METGLDPNNSVIKRLWCIIIPNKTYETKDSETYFRQLPFSISGRLLEAGIFSKTVKKKRSFFKSNWGVGVY